VTERRTSALARAIARVLLTHGATLATAESVTGGRIAAACTALRGSSQWFECAFVTYTPSAKTRLLGVDSALIARHGIVSESVARAMAEGALAHCNAHIAVATTGLAGPDGDDGSTPIGTVCFAWSHRCGDRGVSIQSSSHVFSGTRTQIQNEAVRVALEGVLAVLESRAGAM
jgi:nicotinamide-nucleotide amidase